MGASGPADEARLDRHLDTLLGGAPPADRLDPASETTIRRLLVAARRPRPDPSFVRRLEEELMGTAIRRRPVPLSTLRPGVSPNGRGRTMDRPTPSARPSGRWPSPGWVALAVLALAFLVPSLVEEWRSGLGGGSGAGDNRIVAEATPGAGITPVALRIPRIGVDAEVRPGVSGDEPFPFPPGPWVVGWDADRAALGDGGNVVIAGHLDYWSTGPAVFARLAELAPNDRIEVLGADGLVYVYKVDALRTYSVAAMGSEQLNEVAGPTGEGGLTLVTESGEFDARAGRYLDRLVVRAVFVERSPQAPASPATDSALGTPTTVGSHARP